MEHLREAAVVVVPLRVGGGTRIKIYEAMATGKAVVSTTVGAEGLDIHTGKDIVLSDNARRFRGTLLTLLQDAEARERMGEAARELAANYGWPVIGAKFGEILQRVVQESFKAVPHHAKAGENLDKSPQPL